MYRPTHREFVRIIAGSLEREREGTAYPIGEMDTHNPFKGSR